VADPARQSAGRWLAPLEPLYAGAVALRGSLFDAGWLAVRRAAVPVVSVGNITAGGSGKSPMTAWIAERLARAGRRPAVISRGYGGSHRGPATVVSSGDGPVVDAGIGGDEPVMLASRLPGVPVIVARRRIDGAQVAVERFGARCLVLDDGFQHRALARDLDLVMVDAMEPFGSGRLLPAGALREPLSALRRATALIAHAPDGVAEPAGATAIREAAARYCPGAPVLRSWLRATAVIDPTSGTGAPIDAMEGMKMVCMAAIAHPGRFFDTARRCGTNVVGEFPFADHHPFTGADLDRIARTAREAAAGILTTEKDLARLGPEGARRLPGLRALRMEMVVREEDVLDRLLLGATT
jgi:tetraacyldisaccharide 4'-kinase